ncbi:ADP-ribosylation factor-like protein 13B [Parasteatoda tepidariorum]|uniref:ADP-ribosylation factor-like protein 13B n=1 Tax=Parasteatoda tepidariorum TaxID=114398 RepID=UPI00077FB4E8|nr:ADP-ribosylation factor-like protein 13B [Parasteatoda tepidariorum]
MGNAFSNCFCKKHRIGSMRDITLLMIGLDNAGKTCTVKHLLGESTADAVPTIGFSSISIKEGKSHITIYDLGGGPKIRGIWKKYFALVHGIIFVVDASNPQRFEECKNEIRNVLKHDKIAGKPMLVLVNKQDISGAVDETEIVRRLDLEALVNEQKCPTRVEASCAIYEDAESKIKDPGIQEGFSWLIGLISRDFNELHQRVQEEVDEQKKMEEIEQAERMKRVQRIREERERQAEAAALSEEQSNECNDDDDDDVIIGNPFKPCDVIKAELEERDRKKASETSTPLVKVIHVSPTNSVEASNREEVILQAQPLNKHMLSSQMNGQFSNHAFITETSNGNLSSVLLYEDEDAKKKSRKSKKRFKNRIVPEISESSNLSHISRLGDLPPLRSSIDGGLKGQPCIYTSPKRNMHQNGKINWAVVDELEPCKETSLAGSKRVEAWSEERH